MESAAEQQHSQTSQDSSQDSKDRTTDEPEVRHIPGHHRYEIWVDGERAGLTSYQERHEAIAFLHTEIDDRFGGRGLASRLIATALDDVRASGRPVLPFCPFVKAYIQKHPEYADLVPPDRRREFEITEN